MRVSATEEPASPQEGTGGAGSSSATECLIYCGLSAPTPFTVVVSTRCFSSMSVTASVSGSCSRCSSVVSRDGFPLRVPGESWLSRLDTTQETPGRRSRTLGSEPLVHRPRG